MELSGAQIVVQSLKDEGVEHVFGYPGGSVLHIYDAIFQQEDVRHVLVRHEQGATHAADGYARATGKPGVVLVTSGPGATNVVTGIATAHLDSIPMVVITGQVPSPLIGSDAFQEVDTIGITRPCVKHNFLVKRVEDLAETMKKAFHIANTGRPGPVVVDIPKDVTDPNIKVPYEYPSKVKMRSYSPVEKGHLGQIKKAVELMMGAKRPVIYSGGGVVIGDASAELTELVQKTGFPITNTLMGLGAYPGTDNQNIGMLGMHGTYEANMAMHETDVLVAIGARFDDRVTGKIAEFCPHAKIIHIDVDPASISKNVRIDIPIVGQVKSVLNDMLRILTEREILADADALDAWWKQIESWRAVKCLEYPKSDEVIKPQFAVDTLHKVTDGGLYLTSDVGQHQMFAAQYYPFDKPRRWVNSGGLGTMGFGLPAAIGVQMAHPDATVACITGEASILMCIQELATCKQYNLPLKIILLNNGYMGMVRQWQEMFYEGRYSHSYVDALPDFVELAESFGHVGMRIDKPGELAAGFEEAFSRKDELVFIDVVVDPSENVYPMIEAGKGHHQMHLSPQQATERELA
ncbi:acetolactate synthase 3 large subunit [Solemya velum gill symbiont]|uniref:acetolactate synthase 3 large subunit n=1 Tax=Solemya velum gill symbiont TaxID=2340 RepID=UPI00099801FA|nr:acetolactate synthase 3 large subunit [Solemya velum gill symbiont]OOY59127.1 acetolactate synthase, large subunit, biosynthetic type [Solemya velum gill symbiont]OOY73246.1 acetolactate synthase, large subunit, biosynthetic type [Solemya velum gill symbiont]OOY75193.1 acetolactate synthase, large subunit, biosynthetic type [Solemya velum gill symbiont]OOY81193.1 acetolactate synthase, large subunit, biosynthetic type [Solemya velum gill symbiont]OOY85143.1 acetolactate synthase, large subu